MILARFRTKERDIETDVARVAPIRDAVASALREAEREFAGLNQRLDDSTREAAFLFGNDSASEAGDDPAASAKLSGLESFIVRGQMRRRYLERQIAALRDILATLETIARPRTPGGADGA